MLDESYGNPELNSIFRLFCSAIFIISDIDDPEKLIELINIFLSINMI